MTIYTEPEFSGKQEFSGNPKVLSSPARGIVRFLYCQNPFYVLSAALVFTGLRLSFETAGRAFDVAGLLSSLAAYTLLLATTAWFLIRVGKVWDDVRSLLMLIVLMFLAISVTLDDALAARPARGVWYCLGGWLFAVLVSEALLWGLQIRLRAAFRVPYHLALAHLLLYPALLAPLIEQPHSPALQWALFAFAPLAALIGLALIPAVRRGPDYVANNGTPWKWPLFPWSLFLMLGIGIGLRSYYLCLSLHFVEGGGSIFAGYFLVPLLVSVNLLWLERALATGAVALRRIAMLFPLVWLTVAGLGQRPDAVFQGFEALFTDAFLASPLFVALAGVCGFYIGCFWRRVPHSLDFLTTALLAFSVVGRQSFDLSSLIDPQSLPLLLAAAVQLALSLHRRNSRRAALAASFVSLAVWIGAGELGLSRYGIPLAANVALVAGLAIALLFDDRFAQRLRHLGPWAIVGFCLTAQGFEFRMGRFPSLFEHGYHAWLILLAISCAWRLGNRVYLTAAGTVATAWLMAVGWSCYADLRRLLPGLDLLAGGLACFLAATAISLIKAGVLHRGTLRWIFAATPPKNPGQAGNL